MNAINVIHPYKHAGRWVFDDEAVGLLLEPFVLGADDVIEAMVSSIPDAASGFTLIFSAVPFPGHQAVFDWRREEAGGNWYYSSDLGREGWLCPALFKYFEQAPAQIYAKFEAQRDVNAG